MKGKIIVGNKDVSWDVPELLHPVSEVSCKEPFTVGHGDVKIVAIDTGMKDSMLRCLVSRGATVKVVPYNYDVSKEEFDGLFISNGPGDPARCVETIATVRAAMKKEKPVFGICLGTQLMVRPRGGGVADSLWWCPSGAQLRRSGVVFLYAGRPGLGFFCP